MSPASMINTRAGGKQGLEMSEQPGRYVLKLHSSPSDSSDDAIPSISTQNNEAGMLDKLSSVMANLVKVATKPTMSAKGDVIPPFNPEDRDQSSEKWCHKIDELRDIYGWSEEATIHFALSKLEGLATTWYKGLPTIRFTWSEWKEKIQLAFPSRKDYHEILAEMMQRRKRLDESYSRYFYEKTALLNACGISGENAVSCIIGGIGDVVVQTGAKAGGYGTPEALYRYLSTIPETSGVQTATHAPGWVKGKRFQRRSFRQAVSVTQVDEINDTHNESNEVKVGATQCTLVAAQNALLATAQVDVTDKITSMVPDNNIPIQHFNLPVNIKLADPEFKVTRNIDILIGAEVFWQILESERINISKDLPILQNTKLGWVLAGPLSMPVTKTQCHLSVTDPLQNQLRKFWELEEIPFDSPAWSPEERLCEKHFIENLQVLENGRFMVSLPFKESPDKLGHSREGFDSVNSNHLVDFTSKDDLTSKTLGLVWRPESDILTYKIHSETNHTANITKRQILSKISTIFDPLGLLSPCVIKAKVLLQSLWAESIAWDTPLPVDMRKSWLSLAEGLNILNKLIINRKVVCDKATAISMHAFADASEKSYGACVYIVSENASDRLHSHFWTRWSKEYISELQQRCRWKQTRGDLQIEQLVLMKDDNAPPAKWRLGRVIQLSPGTDGVPRVASLKTENGMTSRAINRLVPLPVVHPQDSHVRGISKETRPSTTNELESTSDSVNSVSSKIQNTNQPQKKIICFQKYKAEWEQHENFKNWVQPSSRRSYFFHCKS
ncbi:unnamed protein product [Acanthoscelides obtectus]|uniref:Retrotransposon gag domain-containing protein n=1 Tax=Acanthoscelides obtectus TaxID=200917 RepID=A0A9P0LI65_ACAOB|nr:unnamed protein product [Acanthoscelides obtectus]CAK1682009.1 hypothetical protein AOBTE_LOCUS33373 [Acanthoscelides obtectus]